MDRTLVLELPEELYEPLADTAKRSGRTPEALATEWLTTAIQSALDDPVESFIGAFVGGISDWANQHDHYLGQTLQNEMHEENSDQEG